MDYHDLQRSCRSQRKRGRKHTINELVKSLLNELVMSLMNHELRMSLTNHELRMSLTNNELRMSLMNHMNVSLMSKRVL